jgi:hypothetical protein
MGAVLRDYKAIAQHQVSRLLKQIAMNQDKKCGRRTQPFALTIRLAGIQSTDG